VSIVLGWKDVVVSIVYRVEMVWSLFARYRHGRDFLVVVVDPINALARV
jgi:hypothetical protein